MSQDISCAMFEAICVSFWKFSVTNSGGKYTSGNCQNGAPEFEVHDILDTQLVNGTRMFLVSWIGYDHSHDSWEPLENLGNCGELVWNF